MNTKLIKKSFRNTGKALSYYKRHIIVAVLAMVMLIGVMCFCGDGYEVTYNGRTYNTSDYAGFFAAPFTMLDDMTSASDLDKIAEMAKVTYDNGRSGAAAILSAPSDTDVITMDSYQMTMLMPLLRQANGLAVVLATWLLVITWAIGFMNQEFKGAQLEEFAKRLLLLGIGFIGVFTAMNLSFYVMNLGSAVAESMAEGANNALSSAEMEAAVNSLKYKMISSAKETKGNIWETIKPAIANFFTSVGYMGQFFIPWLINKVSLILVKWTCWSRNFELIILAVFSPFAFADVVDMHRIGMGTGSKYLKNIGSISLSGAIIILIVALGKIIQMQMIVKFNSGVGFVEASAILGDMALVALATGGLCLKAPQLSKSVLGLG